MAVCVCVQAMLAAKEAHAKEVLEELERVKEGNAQIQSKVWRLCRVEVMVLDACCVWVGAASRELDGDEGS